MGDVVHVFMSTDPEKPQEVRLAGDVDCCYIYDEDGKKVARIASNNARILVFRRIHGMDLDVRREVQGEDYPD